MRNVDYIDKVELGGGANPKSADYYNLDIRTDLEEVDAYCDLENNKLPFPDNSVGEIYSNHTFEHLENYIHILNECWRVLSWGGRLIVKVPHKDCDLAWQDPTHKSYWTEGNMKYFCGDYLKKYSLDYGIETCFKQLSNTVAAPDGRPDYYKEIRFVLKKDKEHFLKVDYDLLKNI